MLQVEFILLSGDACEFIDSYIFSFNGVFQECYEYCVKSVICTVLGSLVGVL